MEQQQRLKCDGFGLNDIFQFVRLCPQSYCKTFIEKLYLQLSTNGAGGTRTCCGESGVKPARNAALQRGDVETPEREKNTKVSQQRSRRHKPNQRVNYAA